MKIPKRRFKGENKRLLRGLWRTLCQRDKDGSRTRDAGNYRKWLKTRRGQQSVARRSARMAWWNRPQSPILSTP